jgi:DNA-binding LacI/PurR family transcriptional regulator/ABC-type glycerol-3-phosphate transport system substrate-binding protein
MPTMKDVALLAGVSHGTVSNVINGSKSVSVEKANRVEEAMKELGYVPNSFARSLKTNKTMQISVILPNIIDFSMSQLFTSISLFANNNKYVVELSITNEIAELETTLLYQALMTKRDGVILVTCQPGNTALFDTLIEAGLKLVFVHRKPDGKDIGSNYNYAGFDIEQSIDKKIYSLKQQGKRKIAIITGPVEYSTESDCLAGFRKSLLKNKIALDDSFVEITNNDRESAMKSAVRLLQLKDAPDVIFTTNNLLAEGVKKAGELLNARLDRDDIEVVSVNSNTWSMTDRDVQNNIHLPFTRLAELSFNLLLDQMASSAKKAQRVIVKSSTKTSSKIAAGNLDINSRQAPLRILLLESDVAYATQSLLPDFKRKTGLDVVIETKKYEEMYQHIQESKDLDKYDVYQIDVPWIGEFAQAGIIGNLKELFEADHSYVDDIIPEIFNEYSFHEGEIFALPYMFCSQLLYYRKDLFDSIKNKRLYNEKNKSELRPPRTWAEFNEVARFFTREYNPESETIYGTTLGSRMASGAVCEYLPRLWSFGGSLTKNGEISIDSSQAVEALENYIESFSYAAENSCDNWWDEQVKEFCSGQAAMMILFNAHATDITDRSKSKVVGKIGFDFIPGQVSLFGGWSLAINKASTRRQQAFDFIKWTCSRDIAIPYTILGNCSPCKAVYDNTEIATIYPWHRTAFEAFKFTKKRSLHLSKDKKWISEHEFEKILGDAVYKAVTGQLDPKNALEMAAQKLKDMIE